MKTVQVLLFISITIAAAGCKNTNSILDDGLREIQVFSSSPNTIKASELFDLEGFATLTPSESAPLRSIRKAVFSNGKIIILDNRTDFQNIYVFDEKTGIFLNKIGYQSESQGGYNELYDIVPGPGKNNITGLVAGKMAFMTYDLSGNLLSTLPNGILVLEPRRIRHIMANNKINMEELGRRHPDLAQTLADKDSENKYTLLYFSTRPVRDGNDPEGTEK